MGTVYRKTFTKPLPTDAELFTRKGERYARWKDAKGKSRTGKLTIGEDRLLISAGTFTAKYRNGAGLVVEKATGCRDETAARRTLGELERRGELVKSGVMTAAEDAIADHQATPLAEQFAEYINHQTAKGLNLDRIKSTRQRLNQVAADCGFRLLADLTGPALEKWMVIRQRDGMSAGSRNGYRDATVGFGNWCVRTGRMISNPFAGVPKADAKVDCRRKRRSMTEGELVQLLDVARRRPLLDAMTVSRGKHKGQAVAKIRPETVARLDLLGRERALIYKTLVLTGLRLNELRSMTVGQLTLDGELCFLTLDAANEKNRQGSTLPIRGDLATDLMNWVANKRERFYGAATVANNGQTAGVIPMTMAPRAELPTSTPLFVVPRGLVRILNRDLRLAGIPKRDERGRTIDVHALRHTFGTLLSKGGVAPRTAQAAMRHSTIDLTMNVYTDPKLLDVHGALDSLPALPLDTVRQSMREGAILKATGTDDLPQSSLAPVLAPTSDFSCTTVSFPDKTAGNRKHAEATRSLDVTSIPVKQKNPLTTAVNGFPKSGRQDLNLRPSGPKPDALAKLSYAPDVSQISLGRGTFNVNGGIAAGESEVHHRVSVMNFQFSGVWTFVHTHDYTIEPILKMMSRFGQQATSR